MEKLWRKVDLVHMIFIGLFSLHNPSTLISYTSNLLINKLAKQLKYGE